MSHIQKLHTHILLTSTLPTCLESIASYERDEKEIESITEYGTETFNRIVGVLSHLRIRLDSIDPDFFNMTTLNNINSAANQVNAYLQNVVNLSSETQLNNLNAQLDSILYHLGFLPQLSGPKELEGIKDTVTSFRKSIARQKGLLEDERRQTIEKGEAITNEFSELSQTFEESNDKISNKYNELEEQFSSLHQSFQEAEDERKEVFKQKMDEIKDSSDSYFTEKEEEWLSLLASSDEEWKAHLDSNKNTFKETVDKLNEVHDTFFSEIKEKAVQYDSDLIKHKKSVENLVGIISTNTISGHFKDVADKKYKLSNMWQGITGFGFAITIGFGMYAFIYSEELDWPALVARFIVTTALGSFTAYAARQVTKNETQEKYSRQMEVELKTLNPYIASFSPEEQIKLKEQLFPYIFGQSETNKTENEIKENSQTLNPTQVENLFEILKNLTDKKNNKIL